MMAHPRTMLLSLTFLLAACAITHDARTAVTASDLAAPGPFPVGQQQVTVTRPNGETFTSLFFCLATSAGTNTPVDPAGAPYPAISFGHGFLQAPSNYQSTLVHLASWGLWRNLRTLHLRIFHIPSGWMGLLLWTCR